MRFNDDDSNLALIYQNTNPVAICADENGSFKSSQYSRIMPNTPALVLLTEQSRESANTDTSRSAPSQQILFVWESGPGSLELEGWAANKLLSCSVF